MPTKVVHCLRQAFDVYIGRPTSQFPRGSPYGNPYHIGQHGDRAQVIRKHRHWLFGASGEFEPPPLVRDIRGMRNQVLGCYCKADTGPPVPCHGDTYAALADSASYLAYCFERTAHPSWWPRLDAALRGAALLELSAALELVPVRALCPAPHRIFRPFRLPFYDVRVVIAGPAPYPDPRYASGLAFGAGREVAESTRNVARECVRDMKVGSFDPTLVRWMRQGVLLLNGALTSDPGSPAGHDGWLGFTGKAVHELSCRGNTVFLLWGERAWRLAQFVEPGNLVLRAEHPAPLTVSGFLGCAHFSKANVWLLRRNLRPVRW